MGVMDNHHPKCAAAYHPYEQDDSIQRSSFNAHFLSQLSFDVRADVSANMFVLNVYHSKSFASWTRPHSLRDFQKLRGSLRKAISRSHNCIAECPWVDAFLSLGFPGSFSTTGYAKVSRRKSIKLHYILKTLQRVILSPTNQKCPVLSNKVADVFVNFLCRNDMQAPHQLGSYADLKTPVKGNVGQMTRRLDDEVESDGFCCSMCALHQWQCPDEEVFSMWQVQRLPTARLKVLASRKWGPSILSSRDSKKLFLTPESEHETKLTMTTIEDEEMQDEGTPKEEFPGSPRLESSSSENCSKYSMKSMRSTLQWKKSTPTTVL